MPEKKKNHTLDRDNEIIPLVRELFSLMAARPDLEMGSSESTNEVKLAECYQKIYNEDLVPLLRKYNVKLESIRYIFSLMLQPFQTLEHVTKLTFDRNRDIADGFKYGIADIKDLRVMDLDTALKTGAAAMLAQAESKPEAKQKKKK